MTRLFKTRYRIVRDSYAGYEAQRKRWWWKWTEIDVNTFTTVKDAEEFCRQVHRDNAVVTEVDLDDGKEGHGVIGLWFDGVRNVTISDISRRALVSTVDAIYSVTLLLVIVLCTIEGCELLHRLYVYLFGNVTKGTLVVWTLLTMFCVAFGLSWCFHDDE